MVFLWLVSTPMFQEESAIAHIAYNIYASATYPYNIYASATYPSRWG